MATPASLAQSVERRSHNPEVVSSILTGSIFKCLFSGSLAQLVERKLHTLEVVSSTLTGVSFFALFCPCGGGRAAITCCKSKEGGGDASGELCWVCWS